MASALVPLVWSPSVEFGGLGMSPASIGLLIAECGSMGSVFQVVAFPRIIRRFGPRRVFITSILCFSPVYFMFPFENLALRHSSHGLNTTVGLLIFLQLLAIPLSNLGLGKLLRTSRSARSLKLVRIDKGPYFCTYHLFPRTSDLSVLQMDSRRQWSRFYERLGRLPRRHCLHSHWRRTS